MATDPTTTAASGPLTVDAIDGGYGVLREDKTIIFATLGEDATEALQWAINHSDGTVKIARTLPIKGDLT